MSHAGPFGPSISLRWLPLARSRENVIVLLLFYFYLFYSIFTALDKDIAVGKD